MSQETALQFLATFLGQILQGDSFLIRGISIVWNCIELESTQANINKTKIKT